ncbi:GNAT family N-acetyltransferase [Leptospira sp. GIMC2001]|uniref:GNAT family N-acetyltransferase n=1 Tax=Leptospira sp. GIMC2001 TaxID=1513297 RepID=UPI00234971B3|nr:GNAT family N-acetyltransferase [Leptospira sp. GIMC2001]WCL50958.1 GNAT family N-acetyltransferase [Leptospira sp. GIMC2001]
MSYKFQWLNSFDSIDSDEWNSIIPLDNPFYDLRFLKNLESSHSIGSELTWQPHPLIYRENDRIEAILVFFIKLDSYGEYIFDFEWANAFNRAGINYYPKLTSAIPFTPATSDKILVRDQSRKKELGYKLLNETISHGAGLGISSIHFLFHSEDEIEILKEMGFYPRLTHQYHWIQRGYQSFAEFLQALKKDRRKTIRKERESLQELGIEVKILESDNIDPELWRLYWRFYQDTHSRKWGQAYLTQDFFVKIFQEFRDKMVLVLALKDGKPIAGSLNFKGENTVFGRYWGATEDVSNLHFECCYYALIEYTIGNGFQKFEAGAQGEHKYMRGFEVVPIYSSHYFYNKDAGVAINRYLVSEASHMRESIVEWNLKSPLKIFREGLQDHG